MNIFQRLPLKDCARCQYRAELLGDGGHCYMFRDEPAGDRCGQFSLDRENAPTPPEQIAARLEDE